MHIVILDPETFQLRFCVGLRIVQWFLPRRGTTSTRLSTPHRRLEKNRRFARALLPRADLPVPSTQKLPRHQRSPDSAHLPVSVPGVCCPLSPSPSSSNAWASISDIHTTLPRRLNLERSSPIFSRHSWDSNPFWFSFSASSRNRLSFFASSTWPWLMVYNLSISVSSRSIHC
ncbi:hypothetical protein BU23DRAFT_155535 [Bimuria novae-zelandiae CBS 107.79]|uniref:Uncharacterized protein n=1 Tax=Bimuria novae-zelandiae CBS 107.79 TaxID=1447943 RepID=A0A6A5V8N4_9PLEO|nr:hypothetical protein BU23DRAFT_155535 [Bimuria novae-zelandiae CBS 107.79]